MADPEAALRAIDKLDKIGPAAVADLLAETAGATEAQAKACLALAEISSEDASFVDAVRALGVRDDLLDEGLDELVRVVEAGPGAPARACSWPSSRSRAASTTTPAPCTRPSCAGTSGSGSICSGGRYDNLASAGTDRYPGVGISVGVSRLLGVLFGASALSVSRSVPTCVLVAVTAEEDRAGVGPDRGRPAPARHPDRGLAERGQVRQADPLRRAPGHPVRLVPGVRGRVRGEVKDIRSGDQVAADPSTWTPPAADLRPTVTAS